ncbi:hypothetical protein [Clostridium sp. Marseille-P2415]|uniref:hypothetical protein n=1 Tax=Clostridium sp. Marseille-P2415 TaxID=1805471 RepID=UPI0011156E55|nr:hypothetical protein [Clostridium sp. Marseille-P2415]
MAIGRMSVVRNADRYFTVAVDECKDWGIKGVMFHGNDSQGICYNSLLEMIMNMDRIFDDIGSPKQTFQMRCFPGAKPPAFVTRRCEEEQREGKEATFFIYVQYRYHASLQGTISWQGGERTEAFESELQLILLIDEILNGRFPESQEGKSLNSCHVSIDVYNSGRIVGNYQNIPAEKVEQFSVPVDLAGSLCNFMEIGISEDETLKYGLNYGQLISSEACSMCRKGGQKASFSIKVMFQEYSTWQGIIYWREGRVQLPFRSFKEMLYMIASAAEAATANDGDRDYGEEAPSFAIGS